MCLLCLETINMVGIYTTGLPIRIVFDGYLLFHEECRDCTCVSGS